MSRLHFPDHFIWGASTSAYQIEGAWNVDGKGESIWDRFTHTPGHIRNSETGDVACDHYNRWPEDITLMAGLGFSAYRFSTAWTRILPTGRGTVNQKGLDFYSRLVDGVLAAGMVPYLCLYHWDLPQALQDNGGWPARATAEAFVEYADIVTRALGDRVKHWMTHNEITCASLLGYVDGNHAPGIRDWQQGLPAAHHLLLSHGWAVQAVRANVPDAQVGMAIDYIPAEPASPSAADYDAFRWFDGYHNRWYLDPLYGRGYPADTVADHERLGNLPQGMAFVRPGDMEAIAAPTDFLGLNYYRRAICRSDSLPERDNALRSVQAGPTTEMGWEIYPQGLYELLMHMHHTYRPRRLFVSENGASYSDAPGPDGRVRDARRREYLRGHIAATQRAIADGAPVAGYFVWSFLDNFEWAHGYAQRFGIVWVDYATQQRILKDSARWLSHVMTAHTLESDSLADPAIDRL